MRVLPCTVPLFTGDLGVGTRGLLEKESFQRGPLSRDSGRDIESSWSVEKQGGPGHLVDIPELLEIPEIHSVKKEDPFCTDPLFCS